MNLKLGSTGDLVRQLEHLLVIEGYPLAEDGVFDTDTEQAVKSYQKRIGLVVDGIAGDKTVATLLVRTKHPKHLSQRDIVNAAKELDVPVASVLAVNEVESIGSGFFNDGRPAILFERHVMYKRLQVNSAQDPDLLAEKYPNLVNKVRGGYKGGSAEYSRLASAKQIDEVSAIESCSWGAFQIMGYHWQVLGYASAADFMEKMNQGESCHLEAFVKFIQIDPALHKALKAKKWADFARLYNGPAYKDNFYDIKLARAYERHAESATA